MYAVEENRRVEGRRKRGGGGKSFGERIGKERSTLEWGGEGN